MKLVIVESPAKAKTINKYLGKDYEVVASFGHIRDLPPKDGSVNPDDDFAMLWEVDSKASKRVSEIAASAKTADRVILATDPDREGEAISWHIVETLKQKRALKETPVERVTFNAITRDAVLEAMRHPREIDQHLVDAYLARRALDYLVGFKLSPVLWRKLPGARSAGRVQSVSLRLVCEREREIDTFVKREYWSLTAHMETKAGGHFEARLVGADGEKIGRLDVGTADQAEAFRNALLAARFTVDSVESKPAKRHPYPPFTTSTLQQEASRKLGLSPARTMQLAQRLYEGIDIGGETVGLITYMRTDGVDMAPEAVQACRSTIEKDFGSLYLPRVPRKYTTKAKNAQEAHEAVRPTDMSRKPAQMARLLDAEQAKLYELIWKRTLASQMESAELERTTVEITAHADKRVLDLRATGQVIKFEGFLKLYTESRDDEGEDEDNRRLPPVSAGDPLKAKEIKADQHFTEPPPRFSEASLVKRMEELGIGRPSTYASIIATLKDRDYVLLEKKRLHATDKGMIVTAFLGNFFARYVEYDFTAALEEDLDRISNNELFWKDVMRRFWTEFSAALDDTSELRIAQVLDALDETMGPHIFPARADGGDPRSCPSCNAGKLSLRLGKFGSFIGCSNYPECKYTRQLGAGGESDGSAADGNPNGPRILGQDPATGLDVTLRDGRFGPYVQLGEGEKPKRQSIPKGMDRSKVDFEQAQLLLSLPREVARHPESGEPILASIGRFGPYVQHGKVYANLGSDDDVLTIGANRAIDLIIAKESGKGGRRFGAAASPGRIVGTHPEGGDITVRDGRYGPYVSHDGVNATLPKGKDPAQVTLEEAIDLIAARIAQGGGKTTKKGTARKTAASQKTAAKAPAKASVKTPAKSKAASEKTPATKSKPTTTKATAKTTTTKSKSPATKTASAKSGAQKRPPKNKTSE
jgi:DNA topoisomerase I